MSANELSVVNRVGPSGASPACTALGPEEVADTSELEFETAANAPKEGVATAWSAVDML